MAQVYQEYFGRFPISTATNDFSIGANALTLTNGYYYIDGYTGETNSQLCNHIQTKIRTIGGQGNAVVSYSHNTGRVSILLNTASNVVWTDTGLATILGFPTSDRASATNHTGNACPRYVWRPSSPAMDYPISLSNIWSPVTSAKYRKSSSGPVHSIGGNTTYETEFAYQALPQADVIPTAGSWSTLYDFFLDVICAGRRLRIYPDRTLNTVNDVHEATWGGEDPGRFIDTVSRLFKQYQGYWRVTLPFWKWISG